MTVKTVGKFEIFNGQKHVRLNRFDWVPTIGNMKIFATGILPDPEMSKYFRYSQLVSSAQPSPDTGNLKIAEIGIVVETVCMCVYRSIKNTFANLRNH